MLPMLCAIRGAMAFAVMMMFGLAAVTHSYFVVGARDLPGGTGMSIYASFQPIWRLAMLGDFDMFFLEGTDAVFEPNAQGVLEPKDPNPGENFALVHGIFMLTTVFLTVLMLNLLVGILGENYSRYEDQALVLFLRERARIITRYSHRPWFARCWGKEWYRQYLWIAKKLEQDVDGMRSMRTAIKRSEKALVSKIDELASSVQRLEQQQTPLRTTQKTLESKIDVLASSVQRLLQKLEPET